MGSAFSCASKDTSISVDSFEHINDNADLEIIIDDTYLEDMDTADDTEPVEGTQTSEWWYINKYCYQYGIVNPHGWHNVGDVDDQFEYWSTQPITEQEFRKRLLSSTTHIYSSHKRPSSMLHPYRGARPKSPSRTRLTDSLEIYRKRQDVGNMDTVRVSGCSVLSS